MSLSVKPSADHAKHIGSAKVYDLIDSEKGRVAVLELPEELFKREESTEEERAAESGHPKDMRGILTKTISVGKTKLNEAALASAISLS